MQRRQNGTAPFATIVVHTKALGHTLSLRIKQRQTKALSAFVFPVSQVGQSTLCRFSPCFRHLHPPPAFLSLVLLLQIAKVGALLEDLLGFIQFITNTVQKAHKPSPLLFLLHQQSNPILTHTHSLYTIANCPRRFFSFPQPAYSCTPSSIQ